MRIKYIKRVSTEEIVVWMKIGEILELIEMVFYLVKSNNVFEVHSIDVTKWVLKSWVYLERLKAVATEQHSA